MFAIIRQGNKQYRVSEGDTLRIDLKYKTDILVGGEGEIRRRGNVGNGKDFTLFALNRHSHVKKISEKNA